MFARSPNRRALFRAAFSASVGGLAWQALGHTQAMASTPPTGLPRLPAPPEDAGTWIDPRMAHPLPGTMSIEPLAGRIATENANKGNTGWDLTIKRAGLYTGDDVTQQIKGYAAADSVEQAIVHALWHATPVTGRAGHHRAALRSLLATTP